MEDAGIKGTMHLTVDDSGMEARLQFVPSEEGGVWDKPRLLKFLEEKSITEGIDEKGIDSILQDNGPVQSAVTAVAARGTPSEPPKAETVEWNELNLPEQRRAEAHGVMEQAGPPRIVLSKTEKVEKKKKQEIPQKLPFMQPKTEVVTVVEKRELREEAPLDPEISAVAWVEKGDKIGSVTPAKAGKVGMNVHGVPVAPEEVTEPAVYTGNGVEKQQTELVAKETGFLRRGPNWAEIIPFSDHAWKLHLSQDNADSLLDFSPGNPAASLPGPEEIVREAEELGYDTGRLKSSEEIALILGKAAESGGPAKNLSVSTDADSKIEVIVPDNRLKACLRIEKGSGAGKKLDLKDVGAVLRESGVKGFRAEQVKADIISFYRSTDFVLEDYVLAEGREKTEPGKPEIEYTVTQLTEKEELHVRKRLEGSGTPELSLRDVQRMGFAVRHQPVLHIIQPEKGTPGRDVYGAELKPEEPQLPEVVLLGNVKAEGQEYAAERAGLFQAAEQNGKILVRVVPYREGAAEVRLSEDRMQAFLTVIPAEGGGSNPELEPILRLIKARGIVRGVQEDRVEAAVREAEAGEPVQDLLIAEGEAPKDAARNRIEFAVELATDSKVSLRKDGSADYRNQNRMTIVGEGQSLAVLLPPEETGQDGWDLTGKKLPARSFQGYDLEIGEGVRKEEQDDGSIKLSAEYEGKLLYDKKSISVKRVHVVDGNVGLSSGNIKFKGAVQIKGSVESGFTVLAGDSISVGEGVDGALISAEGDIVVGQGVKGRGKAVLRTKRSIKAGFIEQATLLAVHDVTLKNFCLRSIVKANGKISLVGEKGHFIGGSVRTRMGMNVVNLGAESGIKTEVSFGQDYLVADQIEIEEREIERIKKKLLEFDKFMAKMEKEGSRNKLEQARKEKFKLMKVMEKRSMRLFTFREKFEEHFPGEIRVRGTVFPGAVIESHGRVLEFKEPKKNIIISFDLENGQLKETTAEKK